MKKMLLLVLCLVYFRRQSMRLIVAMSTNHVVKNINHVAMNNPSYYSTQPLVHRWVE